MRSSLTKALLGLTRKDILPARVILQTASNFTEFIDRSFMVSFIYDVGPGQTDVEVVSAILINQLPILGRQYLQNTTKSDLEDYVDRLAKENP